MLFAATLTYVAEITEPRLRGILSSTAGVAVIFGILLQFVLGTFLSWRTVALISAVAPVASFITLFIVPESPYWLLLKRRDADAQRALAWLRGWAPVEHVAEEFAGLHKEIAIIAKLDRTLKAKLALFTKRNVYWPFSLVVFAFFLSQFCGMSPLQIFAVKIFASFNSPINEYYATVGMGTAEALGCVFSTCLVHFTGKRAMNFFSLLSCALCFVTVGAYAHLHHITELQGFGNAGYAAPVEESIIPIVCLIAVAFCTHTGIKLLPWMLIGEVYSNETRATASGITGAVSYIFGFISIKIFLSLVRWLSLAGTFWVYGGICVVGTVVLWFILPETEGKTLFEITEHFAGRGQLGNKVMLIKNMNKPNGVANSAFEQDTRL